MTIIRPVSDLRNKFSKIKKEVHNNSHDILTKNSFASIVVLSIEEYS